MSQQNRQFSTEGCRFFIPFLENENLFVHNITLDFRKEIVKYGKLNNYAFNVVLFYKFNNAHSFIYNSVFKSKV